MSLLSFMLTFLLQERRVRRQIKIMGEGETVQPFAVEEVGIEFKTIAKRKASDTAGLVIEMIPTCSQRALVPLASWKVSVETILYNTGGPTKPDNYRDHAAYDFI